MAQNIIDSVAQTEAPIGATAHRTADARRRDRPETDERVSVKINISSPANNAFRGSSVQVSGTASCTVTTESNSGTQEEDATGAITKVEVRFGDAGTFQQATATGPGGKWSSWSLTGRTTVPGPLTITARATAEIVGPVGSRLATTTVTVNIELTPPTLTPNPPALVTKPSPPYTTTITGTAADDASGVAAVEWRLGSSGSFQPATGTTNWRAEVTVPGLGAHTVAVRARDNAGNVSPTKTVTITVVDKTPPALSITTPQEDETFTLADESVTVEVKGTASDTQTGVALVEWDLDGQNQFQPATPKVQTPSPNWSTWSAAIPLTTAGDHTITIRATDQAGNPPTTRQRRVRVALPFEPQDPQALFSAAAYLNDLLDFATHRVKTAPEGDSIRRQDLADTFLQPFNALVMPNARAVANQSVQQVRICIEVLRRYLAKHGRGTPAGMEASYRQAAYATLLRNLGTSYEEVRLARMADDATRTALARRLGIGLTQFPSDRLDQLLLQPDQVTEAVLEQRFGLADTSRDALAAGVLPEPEFLIWQKEHLRAVWQRQDEAALSVVETPVPVIDPDLIGEGDLRDPIPGNAAYDFWKARQQQVANQLAAIKATREAQATHLDGFDRIVTDTDTLGPIDALLALAEEYRRGNSIEPQLKAKQLTLQPFLHLMRMRHLAEAGTVVDGEWADVYAILVQVQKFRQYGTWREEERQTSLTLGPDYFKLPDPTSLQTPGALPPWRATPQARRAWRNTLEARARQEQALMQAVQTAVDVSEEATLPMLRDALIAAVDPTLDMLQMAKRLTQELAIDFKSSGHQKITRVHQALETLQGVLFSLRTGRFKSMPPVLGTNPAADWVLALSDPLKPYTEADFDEEWRWMGGYATWYAAMLVFAYPENYLLPELQEKAPQPLPPLPPLPPEERVKYPTDAFLQLMSDLRSSSRLTPEYAHMLVNKYLRPDRGTKPIDQLNTLITQVNASLPDVEKVKLESFLITDQRSEAQLAERGRAIKKLFEKKGFMDGFRNLNQTPPNPVPNYLMEICYFAPMALALQLQKSGQYLAALGWFQTVYAYNLSVNERKLYYGLVLEESIVTKFQRSPDDWLLDGLNPHDIVTVRASAYTRLTLMALVRCFLDFADSEFTRETRESIPRARTLYGTALELLDLPELQPPSHGDETTPPANPFPSNPVLQALRLRAELNLFKLRSGRNIAGLERQSAPESLQSATFGVLPTASDGGRLLRPTPYRYAVLIERAKQLVTIAQQVEAAFLAAIEKRDAEVYNLLKAGHDLDLAEARVELQALRVTETDGSIKLAELQQDLAEIHRDTYSEWIDAGLNEWEQDMLENYRDARTARNWVAGLDAALTVAQAYQAASSSGILGSGVGVHWGGAAAVSLLAVGKGVATIAANEAETAAQINAFHGSYERRKQEWELQRQLAAKEVDIGDQQIALALMQRDIVLQEQSIAGTQFDQAQATVEFLANKFTNAELYEWMSGVLGGVYTYFLQQASAMAQLAQHQLAFERQEPPPSFIQSDYWEASADTATAVGGNGTAPDRRGLTGSARLLQDIFQLDQFAFETNKRKLQLAQTFSLAQLFPAEFQRFRETGSLPFASPMELFDRDFPGHYLRLIKRVRVSVIALVPPTRGIRATLIASGLSRVVSGGDVFQTITVRRDPELIAFTSPSNATGLLELDPEGEMLLPFESMGVDTAWELQMPKAANPFDYRTIADVLMTLEYTALQSFTYRQQVIQQLDDTISAERSFSLRDQFADQWYDLHNPEQTATPMVVRFNTLRQDFPPNVADLRIQHVLLYVVRAEGHTFEIGDARLLFTQQGDTVPVGGPAGDSLEGIISTRRSNAASWTDLIRKSPIGEWELALPNTPEVSNHFKKGEIEDVLFVLSYTGRTPAWPV